LIVVFDSLPDETVPKFQFLGRQALLVRRTLDANLAANIACELCGGEVHWKSEVSE
jgi:hypothetical protein